MGLAGHCASRVQPPQLAPAVSVPGRTAVHAGPTQPPNQGRFYDRFQHVVLLTAPLDVIVDRVVNRSNNPYGKTPEQQQEIDRYVREVEPLLRRGATVRLDGRRPVSELADAVERLLSATS